MYHSSEGATVTEVLNKLSKLEFTISLGKYNYEYKWKENPSADDVIKLVDKVIDVLRGCKVSFHFISSEN